VLDAEADVYAWTKVTPSIVDVDPLPRGGASMSVAGGKVWMFGGQDPISGICFADFVVLDPNTWEWSRPQISGDPPASRHSHVAGVFKDRVIVVYGGAGAQGTLGDVHCFDTETLTWTRPAIGGQAPAAREMAAGCMLADGRLFVHGGRSPEGHVLSDLAVLDLEKMEWVVRRPTQYPRCSHTVASLLVLYGEDGEDAGGRGEKAEAAPGSSGRASPHMSGDGGKKRPASGKSEAHRLSSVNKAGPTAAEGEVPRPAVPLAEGIVLFGGFNGEEVVGDVVEMEPESFLSETAMEIRLKTTAAGTEHEMRKPAPRFAHNAVTVPDPASPGTMMVVFGGMNAGDDLRDVAVWRYSVPEEQQEHEAIDAAATLLNLL